MEQLYINGKRIQLEKGSVAQTFQINDIGDVKDRQASYSNNISIPKTLQNVQAFEMLGLFASRTNLPYERVNVVYSFGGIEIISKGKGIIKESSSSYKMVVYSGVVDLPDLLTGKTLAGLDLSQYDHTLNEAFFFDNIDNTEGVTYALANYCFGKQNPNYIISEMNPSLFINDIWERIFDRIGATYSGAVFSTEEWLSRVMTMTKGYARGSSFEQVLIGNYPRTDEIDQTVNYPSQTFDFLLQTIVSNQDGVMRVSSDVDFVTTNYQALQLLVLKNGAAYDGVLTPVNDGSNTVSLGIDSDINLNEGDVVQVMIRGTYEEITYTQYKLKYTATSYTSFSYINYNIDIEMSSLIGDMTLSDFMKDQMQRFGLIFRPSKSILNHFEFMRLEDLFSDQENAIDWSDKLVSETKSFFESEYAQQNKFKYKYDSSESNESKSWADGVLGINNVNLPQYKTVATSAFNATETLNNKCQLNNWSLQEDTEAASTDLNPNEDSPRIFKITPVDETISYSFVDNGFSQSSYLGTLNKLNFDALRYDLELSRNYPLFSGVVDVYDKKVVRLNLNAVDINNLDFFKLYYFKQLGGHYYLNKINKYIPDKITQVELVRVTGKRGSVGATLKGQIMGASSYSCRSSKLIAKRIIGSQSWESEYYGRIGLTKLLNGQSDWASDYDAHMIIFRESLNLEASDTWNSDYEADLISIKIYEYLNGQSDWASSYGALMNIWRESVDVIGSQLYDSEYLGDLMTFKVYKYFTGQSNWSSNYGADIYMYRETVDVEGSYSGSSNYVGSLESERIYETIEGSYSGSSNYGASLFIYEEQTNVEGNQYWGSNYSAEITVDAGVTEILLSGTGYSSPCGGTADSARYITDPFISIGTIVYRSASVTRPINGQNLWYKDEFLQSIRINGLGQVIAISNCNS